MITDWKGDMIMETEQRHRERYKNETEVREKRRCYASGFEDRGRGHKPENAGSLQKLEKARK